MKVLVADDHALVRETIASFLRSEGFDEVQTAADLDDAIVVAEKKGGFDLVLLDYNMPGMFGLTGLARMKIANAGKPVAILSGSATPEVAADAIKAGAAGFIPKTLSSKSIVSAANFMVAGEVFAPFSFMNQPRAVSAKNLTRRETEVLRHLCQGKANKEIAIDLDLQEVTIKLHIKTICRKLDARNRTHAAMIAKTEQLV